MMNSVFKAIRGIVKLAFFNRADVSAAVVTTTSQTAAFDMIGFGCLSYIINITAASGTSPTLQVDLQVSDDGATWDHVHSSLRFITTGSQRISGIRMSARYYRFSYLVSGTTPSFTLTITSTLKSYLPTRTGSLFRYANIDLTTVGNVSTTFSALSNENISLILIRGADGGSPANVRIQASPDLLNWVDATGNIATAVSTTTLQELSNKANRFYRVRVQTASNAGVRVLDLFWNSNGGGA